MKKKKLSAVSINASTLNSLLPAYYDHTLLGLRNNMPNMSDANNAINAGFYSGGGPGTNYPLKDWCLLLVLHRSNGNIVQLCISISKVLPRMFFRTYRIDTWSDWMEVTTVVKQ